MGGDKATIGQNEVLEALIEGGYLRARITTLTAFDKVAGGLAWGILNSRYSIDVDFIENANIGHKIKIGENIANALKKLMMCPHDLAPHQIQGLDYPKILPVLRWLLIRVRAAREENEHFVTRYTVMDFKRKFGRAVVLPLPSTSRSALAAPPRQFRSEAAQYNDVMEHVNSVLLEYGDKYLVKDVFKADEGVEDAPDAARERAKQEEEEARDAALMEEIMLQMAAHRDKVRLSSSSVGTILGAGQDKIHRERVQYEERRAELQARVEAEERERNAVERLRSRVERLAADVTSAQQQAAADHDGVAAAEAAHAALEEEVGKAKKALKKTKKEVAAQEATFMEDEENVAKLNELTELMRQFDDIQQRTEQAEVEGEEMLAMLKTDAANAAEKLQAVSQDEGHFTQEIEESQARVDGLRAEIAVKNRKIQKYLRAIDEVPSRAELAQYDARLRELADEIGWKYEETKMWYTRYNMLTEKIKYLKNEESLFASFAENYDETRNAKKAAVAQGDLLASIDQIVATLTDANAKLGVKIGNEKATVSTLQQEYAALLAAQRKYYACIKELKELGERNEQLREDAERRDAEQEATHEAQE